MICCDYNLSKEEFEALINQDCYILDKFTYAIELGCGVSTDDNKYLFFQSYVYDYEMHKFLKFCDEFVKDLGFTLAISTRETNFGEICAALDKRGYRKGKAIKHPHGPKALIFDLAS